MTTTKKIITGVLTTLLLIGSTLWDSTYAALSWAVAWWFINASWTEDYQITLNVSPDQDKWFEIYLKSYEAESIWVQVYFVDWTLNRKYPTKYFCASDWDAKVAFAASAAFEWGSKLISTVLTPWESIRKNATVKLAQDVIWKHWCLVIKAWPQTDPAAWTINVITRRVYVIKTSN